MHTVYLANEVASHFTQPVEVKQYGMSDYSKIIKDHPAMIGGVGFHCWHRIVQVEKRAVNPRAIAPYIGRDMIGKPSMIPFISRTIGTEIIKDISVTEATINDPDQLRKLGPGYQHKKLTVATLILVQVHPNNIHIADIYFQNPYRPLPTRQQRFHWASFEGLKMLGPTLARLEVVARERGCEFLTLTASAPDLVKLFGSHGFSLEENAVGRQARAMEKRVA